MLLWVEAPVEPYFVVPLVALSEATCRYEALWSCVSTEISPGAPGSSPRYVTVLEADDDVPIGACPTSGAVLVMVEPLANELSSIAGPRSTLTHS